MDSDKQYGGGMLRRFGLLYFLSGVGLLLRKLRMSDRSANNIREASEKGPVVYVFYTRSKLDWLALNRVLNQRRLPLAEVSLNMRVLWYRPLIDACVQTWGAIKRLTGSLNDKQLLKQTLEKKGVAAIFLTKPSGFFYTNTDALEYLVDLQSNTDMSIQLLPVAVVWQRKPSKERSDLMRFILGSEDQPGPLMKLFSVVNRDHEPIIQAGESVELNEVLERYANQPAKRQIRVARLLLKGYLYREMHAIQGPKIRSFDWFRRQIQLAPEVKALIQSEAKRTGKSVERLRNEVDKTVEHIAARFSFRILKAFALFCRFVWNQIFSGVDLRPEDIERMREAVRTGTPILVPSHRSHLDYLLIGSQCYEHGLVLPYVVAGENLSFFPMGLLFRGSGAFFIKRSFKEDPIFPTVFERYVRLLIREEIPVEFFIEGGRSRTGKLLHPKLGMLRMVVNSAVHMKSDRILTILPIAFSYEQIAEEKSYAKELSGRSKQKESVSGVLKARKILKKRYGKVYMRVGEPIYLNQIIAGFDTHWDEMEEPAQKEQLKGIATQIMHGIGQNMLILPTGITALALLSDHRPGISLNRVHERAERYDRLLRHQGAMAAESLNHGKEIVEQALQRFTSERWIERLEDAQGVVIRVVPDSRITMEYYKNGLMHFLAPISLLAAAIVATDGDCQGDETLRLFLEQSFVLRFEFPAHPTYNFRQLAEVSRQSMVEYGALRTSEEDGEVSYEVDSMEMLHELASLTTNFLETYICVLRACQSFAAIKISEKELKRKIQDYAKARLAVAEILRPEALSSVNIANALFSFKDEGILTFTDSGFTMDEEVWEQHRRDLTTIVKRMNR